MPLTQLSSPHPGAPAGIMAGSQVEVRSLMRDAEGDLRLGLITTPPTYTFVHDGPEADALEAMWANKHRRIVVPMPPAHALAVDEDC